MLNIYKIRGGKVYIDDIIRPIKYGRLRIPSSRKIYEILRFTESSLRESHHQVAVVVIQNQLKLLCYLSVTIIRYFQVLLLLYSFIYYPMTLFIDPWTEVDMMSYTDGVLMEELAQRGACDLKV